MAGARHLRRPVPSRWGRRRTLGAALAVIGAVGVTLGATTSPASAAVATITTSATPTVTFGGSITDTATVTGEAQSPAPTGTVTFTLFGPSNPGCSGIPIFTSAARPLGGGPPPTATSSSFVPTQTGTYNWVAVYSGDANYASVTSPCGAPNETSTLAAPAATITTSATPTVNIGGSISDTATVAGPPEAPAPTGHVFFTLFGPGNPTCSGTPIFASPLVALTAGPPPTATTGTFTPVAVGSYNWVAVYSGDSNYFSATSPCGSPNETSVVTTPVATITTSATPTATLGGNISDTATVTGAPQSPAPTGTVTFTLYGPANPTCTGSPIFTSVKALGGGPPPTATSDPFTPTAVGTYNWVAAYSGDATYASVFSPCGAPDESSVITAASTITVDKTATPLTRPEPGGDFTFDVVVTNTGSTVLTITSLTDDIYGNIANLGTCTDAVGTVLQPSPGPGNAYSCSFTGSFTGDAGDSQTDVVSVASTDPTGTTISDTDDATVAITDTDPSVTLLLTVDPASRPAPGGSFTYTVVVTNVGIETGTITSLTDDVYGDLATSGTCTSAVGTVLDPTENYQCTYAGDFTGAAGATQTNIVSTVFDDDDEVQVSSTGDVDAAGFDGAFDDATITITAAPIVTTTTATTATTAPPAVGGSALPRTGGSSGGLVPPALLLLLLGGLLVMEDVRRRGLRPDPAHVRRPHHARRHRHFRR